MKTATVKRTVLLAAALAGALVLGIGAGIFAGSRHPELVAAAPHTTTQLHRVVVTETLPAETVTDVATTTVHRTKIKTVTVEPEPSLATVLSGERDDPQCSWFSNKWKRCGTVMPTASVRVGGYLAWSCTYGCEFVDSTGEVSVAEDGAHGPTHGELYVGPGEYSVKLWANGKYVIRFPA